MLTQQELKLKVAWAAMDYVLPYLEPDAVLGVGTGSTVDAFIDVLAQHKALFRAAVSSSTRSTRRMLDRGIAVLDLDQVSTIPLYVDGADEIDYAFNMIKGGGGALTREKIIASAADQFVCIADESKRVQTLGAFPLPIEVIPMAVGVVGRRLLALGGVAVQRPGFVTDNGCAVLDVSGLDMSDPPHLESEINDIPGVVTCGLFAISGADVALISTQDGVQRYLSRR